MEQTEYGEEDKKRKKKSRKKNTKLRGIVKILICVGILYVLMYGFATLGFAVSMYFCPGRLEEITEIFGNVGIGLTALIACFMLRSETGERLRDAVSFRDFRFSLVIAVTLAGWSLGEVCDHLMGLILSDHMTIVPDVNSMEGIVGVISAVICAPIFEELIFRFSFMGLLKKNSGMVFTILVTTFVFAAGHFYNVQGTGNVFMGTVLAAYVYYKTENILYTMCEHAIHNGLCYIPLENVKFLGVDVYYEKNGFILAGWPWFLCNLAVLCLTMAWLAWFFRFSGWKRKQELKGLSDEEILES